ncbi:MAG: hypothetical protein MJE77_33505 [Proteobacteria bacterium]|nr:hypothetical protein [Pseudomonadota bacterium]
MSGLSPGPTSIESYVLSDDGRHVLVSLDGATYRFRRLLWIERNRAVHCAVDGGSRADELNPLSFAHRLLEESLQAVICDGQPELESPAQLAGRNADLSQRLLEIAVHINRRQPREAEKRVYCDQSVEVRISDKLYKLAPWTWGVRNSIVADGIPGRTVAPLRHNSTAPRVSGHSNEAGRVGKHRPAGAETVHFHELVLRTMCVAVDGLSPSSNWLAELHADIGDALLDIALSMSGLDRDQEIDVIRALQSGHANDGLTMYTLCKEFGWTPAQIRQQLATDIDVLVAVHRASRGGQPSRADDQPRTGDELAIRTTDDE